MTDPALRARVEELEQRDVALRITLKVEQDESLRMREQLAEAQAQWTKTNGQYEQAAKAVTRLTGELSTLRAAHEARGEALKQIALHSRRDRTILTSDMPRIHGIAQQALAATAQGEEE